MVGWHTWFHNMPLRWRLGGVALCFLLLVGASAAATYQTAQAQADDARLINLAGRLRMLTQRTALLAIITPTDPEIERIADQIETTFQVMRTGGELIGVHGDRFMLAAADEPALEAALGELSASWQEYRPILRAPPSETALVSGARQVVERIDEVVTIYEGQARDKVARLLSIQRFFLLSALLLAAAGYLVFQNGVLYPLHRLGRAAALLGAGALDQPTPDLGQNEFGQLAQHFEAMRLELQTHQAELKTKIEQQALIMEERQQLAADLHDNLAQTLSFVRLKVEAGEIERALEGLDQAYCQLRAALVDLHAPPLTGCDLVEKLVECTAEFKSRSGLPVLLELGEADEWRLERLAQEQAVHIIREGLNNIHRHARAARVRLTLTTGPSPHTVSIILEDDGCGFRPQEIGAGHLGLKIMQTRARRIGGQLEVQSALHQGTRLHLVLPTSLD